MRQPDFVIGDKADPYLERWHVLPRNRWFNVYLHHFRHSDDDRAKHDHPYFNMSILLSGSYVEYIDANSVKVRKPWRPWAPWRIVARRATTPHRVELPDGVGVWTLFVTGPRVREWGFHCPNGWRHWRDFVDTRDAGSIGRGCD